MRNFVVVVLLALASPLLAQEPVAYEISFPNAVHHEAEITVTFAGLDAAPLEVRMSRASPGRYAIHEFAKNVYAVRASDGRGRPLRVERPDPYGDVPEHDGTVLSYTLFADRADGTYSGRPHARAPEHPGDLWARLEDRWSVSACPRGAGVEARRSSRRTTRGPSRRRTWRTSQPDRAERLRAPGVPLSRTVGATRSRSPCTTTARTPTRCLR